MATAAMAETCSWW